MPRLYDTRASSAITWNNADARRRDVARIGTYEKFAQGCRFPARLAGAAGVRCARHRTMRNTSG
jgi:hypothetical protein